MQNMEFEELGKTSLTAVELETLDWTLSKQKKLTALPELCISFHMNEIVCHAMLFFLIWLLLNVAGSVWLISQRLLS